VFSYSHYLADNLKIFDVVIIGAGPAGCSAALTFKNSNYKVALIDKHSFPREKICGDGLCDRSINVLKKLSPSYFEEFLQLSPSKKINKTYIFYNSKKYNVGFDNYGYTIERKKFDDFLLSLVKRDCSNVSISENTKIINIEQKADSVLVYSANGNVFSCKILILASGQNSTLINFLNVSPDKNAKSAFTIRAYFENVESVDNDTIEIHYDKKVFPGYFWIFPVDENKVNVGFGLKYNKKRNMKSIFEDWIQQPYIKKRFKNSTQLSALKGSFIPYNTGNYNIAGDRFLIAGDSASLADPFSFAGIGNAMLSGNFAASTCLSCLELNKFDYLTTKKYEVALKSRILKEASFRLKIQRILTSNKYILDIVAFLGNANVVLNYFKRYYFKK